MARPPSPQFGVIASPGLGRRASRPPRNTRPGDHLRRDETIPGLDHRVERSLAVHARQTQAVLGDRRHRRPQVLEVRQIVLAQDRSTLGSRVVKVEC